jgi:phage terminase small subunit
MAKNKITPKQKRFADEYLVDYNGRQAATRAGYSAHTAHSQSTQLLAKPAVKEYLNKKMTRIADKLEMSAERTLQEINRIALSDLRKYFEDNGQLKPITALGDDAAAALHSVDSEELFEWVQRGDKKEREQIGFTKKIRVHDKVRALEMLMKYYKLLGDEGESKVNLNVTIKKGGKHADG